MNKFFKLLWTILWCAPIFIIVITFFSLLMLFLLIIKQYYLAREIPRIVSKILLFAFGIRVKSHGREKINFDQQQIYVFNHLSNIDPFTSSVQIPPQSRYLAKAEILKYPGFGMALKHLHVPVQRYDKNDRDRSLKDLFDAVEQGHSLVIFPEGTRNAGPELLKRFRKGAFYVSAKSKVPIVTCTGVNVHRILSARSFLLSPGTIDFYWDGPFYPEETDIENQDHYIDKVKKAMNDRMLIANPSGKLYDDDV